MKKLPLSLLFILATCWSVFAGEIYVFHDSSCMDKLSFKEKSLTADYKLKTTANLISYNVRANDNEIIRLDISTEGDEILNDMPIGTKNCNELIWDEQFAKDINAQVSDIFIVSLEDGKYRISSVERASYFYSTEDEITFGDDNFGFSFDQGEFDTNADLLTYGLKSKVKFSFADDMHCPGEFHFYKSTKGRNLSENEMVIVPGLGVIKNYTISKKLNRNLREVELNKVNDMPLTTYMEHKCTTTTAPTKVVEAKSNGKSTEGAITTTTVKTTAPATRTVDVLTTKGATTTTVKTTATAAIQTCQHIYRNADTGFYYDRNTGLPAEGDCGGITYTTGTMQNSDYQSTTATTELVSNAPIENEFTSKGGELIAVEETKTETVEAVEASTEIVTAVATPAQKIIVKESKPKIIYKEPKVIYKESAPIVIDASIEPQDTKIITHTTIKKAAIATNLDCSVTPRIGYHLVKKGETLYRLSNMYSASIEDLMQWNNLNSSSISVCQHLRVQPEISMTQTVNIIPANEFVSKGGPVNTLVSPVPVKRQYHYVSQGETLYALAKKYAVNVSDLKKLNKINDNYLKPGWRLLIPNSSDVITEETAPIVVPVQAAKAAPAAEMVPKGGSSMKIPESSEARLNTYQNQHIYHTVGEDETINDIAMKYGTSINALKILNEMSEGEVLIPFQKIKVR